MNLNINITGNGAETGSKSVATPSAAGSRAKKTKANDGKAKPAADGFPSQTQPKKQTARSSNQSKPKAEPRGKNACENDSKLPANKASATQSQPKKQTARSSNASKPKAEPKGKSKPENKTGLPPDDYMAQVQPKKQTARSETLTKAWNEAQAMGRSMSTCLREMKAKGEAKQMAPAKIKSTPRAKPMPKIENGLRVKEESPEQGSSPHRHLQPFVS